MKSSITLILAGMIVLFLGATSGFAENEPKTMMGAGMVSCGQYLADLETSSLLGHSYTGWSQGFLSAMNVLLGSEEHEMTDLSDFNGQEIWLNNFCKENPLENSSTGVILMWKELRRIQRLAPAP